MDNIMIIIPMEIDLDQDVKINSYNDTNNDFIAHNYIYDNNTDSLHSNI
jgi:hypothetical protein